MAEDRSAGPVALLKNPWLWTLVYTLFVILFGAVVRITGSGAGCGQHWPTCKGEVAHLPQSVETAIELTHRITSGTSMLLVWGLAWYSFRRGKQVDKLSPEQAWARRQEKRAALGASLGMLFEALVGAALVLLALVGKNDSVSRALVMAAHLCVTSFLLYFLVRVLVFSSGIVQPREAVPAGRARLLGRVGIVALLLVSAAGAVTALGDTLYPVEGATGAPYAAWGESLASVLVGQGHFLTRLRSLHPFVAAIAVGYLYWASARLGASLRASWTLRALLGVQLLAGLLNVALRAPGWMQVLHLAIANFIWMTWVYLLHAQERWQLD